MFPQLTMFFRSFSSLPSLRRNEPYLQIQTRALLGLSHSEESHFFDVVIDTDLSQSEHSIPLATEILLG